MPESAPTPWAISGPLNEELKEWPTTKPLCYALSSTYRMVFLGIMRISSRKTFDAERVLSMSLTLAISMVRCNMR